MFFFQNTFSYQKYNFIFKIMFLQKMKNIFMFYCWDVFNNKNIISKEKKRVILFLNYNNWIFLSVKNLIVVFPTFKFWKVWKYFIYFILRWVEKLKVYLSFVFVIFPFSILSKFYKFTFWTAWRRGNSFRDILCAFLSILLSIWTSFFLILGTFLFFSSS